MRSYSESTQIGFRLRGLEPGDLYRYPPEQRKVFWGFVVDAGLKRKDAELAKGLDKDGHPLKPLKLRSIKYRKSEVGPTRKTAPPLEPALALSRVRSLLVGRPHTDSAEFWWGFDAISGKSFAFVLRAQREQGRDVFGLSPAGQAWVRAKAWDAWERWKQTQFIAKEIQRPSTLGRQLPKYQVKREIHGRVDIKNIDVSGHEELIKREIAAGRFTGFRRLNVRGEQWKPGAGLGTVTKAPSAPKTPSAPKAPSALQPVSSAAQNISRAIEYGKAAGYEFRKISREQLQNYGYTDMQIQSTPAFYDYNVNTLYVNPHSSFWETAAEDARLLHEQGWWSTSQYLGVIAHEIGHFKHHQAIGKDYFLPIMRSELALSAPEKDLIRNHVSSYAATNPVELIAEVQAGVKFGKHYSSEIWEIYRKFRGPQIEGMP